MMQDWFVDAVTRPDTGHWHWQVAGNWIVNHSPGRLINPTGSGNPSFVCSLHEELRGSDGANIAFYDNHVEGHNFGNLERVGFAEDQWGWIYSVPPR